MLRFISICLILIASTCQALCQNRLYQLWKELPSEELLEMGRKLSANNMSSDSAMMCFAIVSNRYYDGMSKADKKTCALAMNNLACCYTYGNINYPRAYEYLEKAQRIAEDINDTRTSAIVYHNFGNLYFIYGNQLGIENMCKKGREMYRKSYHKAAEVKFHFLQLSAFINNFSDNRFNQPLDEFKGIFSDDIPANTTGLQNARFLYQAVDCIQKKKYEQARNYLYKVLNVIEFEWAKETYLLATYMAIGKTHELEKQYSNAIVTYHKVEKMAQESHDFNTLSNVYKALWQAHKALGNEEEAKHYYLDYLMKKDSVITTFGLSSVGELSSRHDLHEAEEKTKALVIEQRIRKTQLTMALLLLLVLVGSLIVMIRKNKQLRMRNRKLYENNLQNLHIEAEVKELRRQKEEQALQEKSPKYTSSALNDDERKEELYQRICTILDQNEWVFKPDFSLQKLAELVESNKTYVSQVINEKSGNSFNILLSNRRVNEACRRINDVDNYGQLTLEAISESVGFKSRTTFTTAFKRVTGLTPSEYQKLARLPHEQ